MNNGTGRVGERVGVIEDVTSPIKDFLHSGSANGYNYNPNAENQTHEPEENLSDDSIEIKAH